MKKNRLWTTLTIVFCSLITYNTMAQNERIAAITELKAKPAYRQEVENAAKKIQKDALMENGLLEFRLNTKIDDPNTFVFYEVFENQTALDHHKKEAHTIAFGKSIEGKYASNKVTFMHLQMVDTSYNRGIEHIGMAVPDVNAASKFLEKALGGVSLYDVLPENGKPFEGAETEHELGIPKGSKIVHMRLVRIGNGPNIELFQFANAPQKTAGGLNDIGVNHIAIYTDNIQKSVAQFKAAGGTMLSDVHGLANAEDGKDNRGVYGKAPWGTLIEFITYPDGVQYPASAPEKRWKPF
ncbi:antibiotic biosynthesis monooxygenase [Rhizosphaericola mali]|uniref:Antibiotic biosynthesis monooxygenase n=1 Tax=Rhizosphaericola mali TaxID=2545455 RepID=A0A5P2G6P6_9BACT|nr:antibiotic biosynthesis monooxygenase [Rhizosphaericola mali]QES89460.1 hypothetical protein E0W69_012560 [Rhizosphaericola mali]